MLSFNESTGAYQSTIISSPAEFEGLAIGPDQRAYVATNAFGFGQVLSANAYDGSSPATYTGYALNYAVPMGITWGPDQNLYTCRSNAFYAATNTL